MNGIIRAKTNGEQTFNLFGEPIVNTISFGSNIPCKYQAANRNDIVETGDGTFQQASFIITTQIMDFKATHIELLDDNGNVVCRKDVRSLEVLKSIGRVKILI